MAKSSSNILKRFIRCKGFTLTNGENGIRTHGTFTCTHAFQACPFGHSGISPNQLAYPAGIEPTTYCLEGNCSILLSYGYMIQGHFINKRG